MKKRRQKTRGEILAELMQKSLNTPRNAEDILAIGRKLKCDRNIQLGHNIALGLVLVELMKAYEWEKDDIIGFVKLFDEYKAVYDNDDPECKEITINYFKELFEFTGYDVLSGTITKEVPDENIHTDGV